jgi:predicted house-cleaning noncanonical NTP pyrophosphatase (MazG superfamily)
MIEYILFDESLRDRFLKIVAGQGIASEVRADQIEGFVVALSDDLADEVVDLLEDEYDALMVEQRCLVESLDGNKARTLMGVNITLPDGQQRMVPLPAIFARRLYEHFTIEEIQQCVSGIAESVLKPDAGSLCRNV